jgi:hypothetical protein
MFALGDKCVQVEFRDEIGSKIRNTIIEGLSKLYMTKCFSVILETFAEVFCLGYD